MYLLKDKIWIKYCEYFQKWVFYHALLIVQVPNHNNTWKVEKHKITAYCSYQEMCIKSKLGIWSMFFFHCTFLSSVSLVGIVKSSLTLFCTFLSFLRFICKHFVKMYILGKLFLYAIGMLYNALMFKLSVLYFFNCLVVIAQQNNVLEVINSD